MIKLFEQFNNEQEIKDICKKYDIRNYTINPDGSIDVDGDVNLMSFSFENLPLRFNKVTGFFECSTVGLTSLEGCPKEVGRYFSCSLNKLKSLKGAPNFVGSFFNCTNNKLTSLEGCPIEINTTFYCTDNKLTTLKGAPILISGDLFVEQNPISIIDSSIEVKSGKIYINGTNFDDKIKKLSQEDLKILFEHGVDYNIFRNDGSINHSRLERLFKDFNI